MAWLNATPKPPPGTKRAEADQSKAISRIEKMKRHGIVPALPDSPFPHIIDRLVEIGLTEAAGMGAAPLSWQSIRAWQEVLSVSLSRWEARMIRKLSVEYLAESRRAESENCPAPWRGEITEREKQVELQSLVMVLG